ncbi:hypothetical protein [Mycobacterium sp.]|uniref:hypothetical protein n=1 Tax=Mycobacterium sp. TaxID=1785 RepID=UPI002C29F81A|nr:hypothetical protein [Mycobacterium sp.]HKP44139.1 hypothetical protein [Mycobacterium sp.]
MIFFHFVRLARAGTELPLTAAAVCDAAGVSQAAFYKQFPGGLTELVEQMAAFMAYRVERQVRSDLAVHQEEQPLEVAVTTIRLVEETMRFSNMFRTEHISQSARTQLAAPLLSAISHDRRSSMFLSPTRASTIAQYHTDALLGIIGSDSHVSVKEVAETMVSQVVPVVILDDYTVLLQCLELLDLVEGSRFRATGGADRVPKLWLSTDARIRHELDRLREGKTEVHPIGDPAGGSRPIQ